MDEPKACMCVPDNETLYPSMNNSEWSHVSEEDCHTVSDTDMIHITFPVVSFADVLLSSGNSQVVSDYDMSFEVCVLISHLHLLY